MWISPTSPKAKVQKRGYCRYKPDILFTSVTSEEFKTMSPDKKAKVLLVNRQKHPLNPAKLIYRRSLWTPEWETRTFVKESQVKESKVKESKVKETKTEIKQEELSGKISKEIIQAFDFQEDVKENKSDSKDTLKNFAGNMFGMCMPGVGREYLSDISHLMEVNPSLISDGPFKLYVARLNPTTIVAIGVLIWWFTDVVEIALVCTGNEYRKKGAATIIIQKMIQDALKSGARLIFLNVSTEKLIPFYKKLGFESTMNVHDQDKNNPKVRLIFSIDEQLLEIANKELQKLHPGESLENIEANVWRNRAEGKPPRNFWEFMKNAPMQWENRINQMIYIK